MKNFAVTYHFNFAAESPAAAEAAIHANLDTVPGVSAPIITEIVEEMENPPGPHPLTVGWGFRD